jgi:hypothetical protein
MLGKTLAQYCPTDSALAKEQQRIEAELKAFEKNLFGNTVVKRDSTDSLALLAKTDKKAAKKLRQSKAAAAREAKASRSRKSRTSSSASSGAARVTVRRQRH